MADKRTNMRIIQREANRICSLILSTDLPEVDILIERARLRDRCEEMFPGSEQLYEMIYESRFDRLMEQFGADRPSGENDDSGFDEGEFADNG